eukprot:963582-Pleurochrysis_carterae.AAC.2
MRCLGLEQETGAYKRVCENRKSGVWVSTYQHSVFESIPEYPGYSCPMPCYYYHGTEQYPFAPKL